MADTIRTLAEIAILLADNTTGQVSPQDVRDALASMSVFGVIGVSTGATPQNADLAPAKLTCWTFASGLNRNVTEDVNNSRLVVNSDGVYIAFWSLSFTGTANAEITTALYKDLIATNWRSTRKIGTGGDIGHLSGFGIVSCVAGEVLEVFQNSDDDGDSITGVDGCFFIMRLW